MKTYVTIRTDASMEAFTCDPTRELKQLQEAVGGYITEVPLRDGRLLYANDEGLLEGLPVNTVASDLAGTLIVGNVVLTGGYDHEGNTLGLSASQLRQIML